MKELETELKRLVKSRAAQEVTLENIKKMAAALGEQRKLVDTLARQVEAAARRLADLEARVAVRTQERDSYAEMLARAPATQAAYDAWQTARADLEKWDSIAAQFREHEKRRQPFLDELNAARATLLQEQQALLRQQESVTGYQSAIVTHQAQIEKVRLSLAQAEEQLTQRAALDAQLQEARQRQAEAKAENPRLKGEMDELKTRIDELQAAEGANCPLCGQPLTPEDRQKLIEELKTSGTQMGDRYRANLGILRDADQRVNSLQLAIGRLQPAENDRLTYTQALAQLTARLDQLQQQIAIWETEGVPRLKELTLDLQQDTFHPAGPRPARRDRCRAESDRV